MKKSSLFFMILAPFFCSAQVNDSFLDGNFINNPIWSGSTSNFTVNSALQLQSQATTTSTSWLFTPSEAFDDAVWECWVKIAYSTSASNYASVYLTSDRNDLSSGCNGYYVQIGGTNDEVSLFVQEGTKKTKIIDGTDKRTDGNPVELRIKVTRDARGNFTLYSKKPTETDFVTEGTTTNNTLKGETYFGLLYANTSTTGSAYYFDDIVVTGHKAPDVEAPQWTSFTLEQPNMLKLFFSEPMDFSKAAFSVDKAVGDPTSQTVADDKSSIVLNFSSDFERGTIYTLQVSGLTDLAGNALPEAQRSIGIIEAKAEGDLRINEVMFENPLNSLEYLEIYNNSEKVIDVSGLVFTIRKTDGSLNTGNKIPTQTWMLPHGYLALCENADSLRKYHHCPPEANIITSGWSSLNNECATLVLTDATKDTIYDELTYNSKWHHVLVKNPKGVALERINPQLPTQYQASWHSAASEVNYGTPGYLNSQYRDILSVNSEQKTVWLESEDFSPDNDGVDDVCFVKYKTDADGYVANAIILNAVGVKVYHLATNILLSSEGFLSWDGRTDAGRVANTGVYILYFEMFNPKTGARKQLKLPVVVSSR
jgi:hypothetical protein